MAFSVVSGKAVGDTISELNWDRDIADNLNIGVIRPIAETVLAGSAANIDFTGIAASWRHLLLVAYLRTDRATVQDLAIVRLNGDSGANYDRQNLTANGTTVTAAEALAASSMNAPQISGASSPANVFGGFALFIPHYANAANNKTAVYLNGSKLGTATGEIYVAIGHGQWRSNAAITQITLLPNVGPNFVAGSCCTVYGLGNL